MSYNLDNVQKTFINSNSILIETTGTFTDNLILTEDITVYNTNIINMTENVTGSVQYNNYTTINNVLGSQGYRGSQGDSNGSQGFMGFQGSIGTQGGLGFQGVQGVQGNMGFQGNQGLIGNQGPIGNQGRIGQQMVVFAYTGDLNGVSTSASNIGQYAVVNKDLYVYNGTGFVLCTQLFRENEGAGIGNRGPQGNVGVQGNMGFQGVAGGGSISYSSYAFTGNSYGLLYFDENNVLNGSRMINTGAIMRITPYATKSTGTQMTLNTINRYATMYLHSTGSAVALSAGTGTTSNMGYYSIDGYNYSNLNSGYTGVFSSISMSADTQYQTLIERGNGVCRVLVSNDYGKTFSSNAPVSASGPFYNIVCVSSSGQYQTVGTQVFNTAQGINTGIWRSSDYGVNWSRWTGYNGVNNISSIKMSLSGQYQAIADNGFGVWRSSDYGQTFSRFSFSDNLVPSIAMSDSGEYIYFGHNQVTGAVYRSSNYGSTFSIVFQNVNCRYITYIECSPDGSQIIINTSPTTPTTYYSSNYGVNFTDLGFLIQVSKRDITTLIRAFTNYNLITYDRGTTWQFLNKNIGIAMSFDGLKQTIIQNIGNIYTSITSGSTFLIGNSTRNFNRNWRDIAMDADGYYQAAVGLYLTTSSNGGNTWTDKNSIRDWRGVAVSYGWGTYQTAVAYNDYIYISSDSGATFSPVESVRNWNSVSIDSNGQYQTAVVFGGQIYTSSDYGVTWTARDSNRNWKRVSVSPNGMYQTAIVNNGYIYTSSNYGVTWTQRDSQRYWNYISVTDNLQVACASDFYTSTPDYIYISRNRGVTWEPYGEQDYWTCVAISFDNLTMTACKFTDIAQHRFSFTAVTPVMLIDNQTRSIGLARAFPLHPLDLGTDFARKLTTTTWLVDSDERVKENIEDADLDLCYNNVKNMNLKRFKWREEFYPEVTDRNSVGFIAQEVEQVFPKSVLKADEEVNNQFISDFRSLDADQIYKSMYGGLQKCILKLEDLKNRQKNL